MNDIKNLPTKYAVLELKEESGYLNNYEDITRGFIATKCYVYEEVIRHNLNGTSKKLYRVFFPYKNLEVYKISTQYGLENKFDSNFNISLDIYGNVRNLDIVSNIYDTYEEAKKEANDKNKKLILDEINESVKVNDKYYENAKKVREALLYEIHFCNMFEEEINNIDNEKKLALK